MADTKTDENGEDEPEPMLHPDHINCFEYDDDEAALLEEERIGEGLTDWFVDDTFYGIDAIYFDGLRPPQGALPADLIQWRRIGKGEVATVDKPILFQKQAGDKIIIGDLQQGQLNNKWLTNAFAALTANPNVLDMLFVSSKYRSKGLYTVKLFKDGRWHYMHIDDRIPVDLSGRPIYLRGVNPNETWSMLLEKAYAKLHGCYESLASGFIDEALRDLTAGATLYLDLNQGKGEMLKNGENNELWQFLKNAIADEAVVTATRTGFAPIPPNGLSGDAKCRVLEGNAYVVLFAAIIEDPLTKLKTKIVRCKNPWGLRTWGGKWSVNSVEWTDYPKMKVQLETMLPNYEWGADDGTFFMTYEDFIEQFNILNLLYIIPDEWVQEKYMGEWAEESTVTGQGGAAINLNKETFPTNPMYGFSISNESDVHIQLSQKDKRWMTGKADYRNMAIGFCVCELTGSHLRLHEFWDGKCQNMPVYGQLRQVAERIVLAPGNYAVICSTYNAKVYGEFYLDLNISTPADIFDSNEEEDGSSVVPEGADKEEESKTGEPIPRYKIANIKPDEESLVSLTLRAMQRTISNLGSSANDLRTEIEELEKRTADLEAKN